MVEQPIRNRQVASSTLALGSIFSMIYEPPKPEAQVLDAARREFHVAFPKVRSAITYLRQEFDSEHPLRNKRLRQTVATYLSEALGNS